MEIRPLTEAEQKYAYKQSMQLRMQTGSIGVMNGGYKTNGEFYCKFYDLNMQWKSGEFQEELDRILAHLSSAPNGFLQNLTTMRDYMKQHSENVFHGEEGTEYGFRVTTNNYAYLIRCNPAKRNDNVEIHCYVKEWLDKHIKNAEKGIRFIDGKYNELFKIADGERIVITDPFNGKEEHTCRYIDEYHTEIGSHLYHICQFAEIMERNGATYASVKKEKPMKKETKTINGKDSLIYHSEFIGDTAVELNIQQYINNGRIAVELISYEEGEPEPFGSLTVNIDAPAPDYCGYLDINNLSNAEKFVTENELGEFTGLTGRSGYCEYPLYLFNVDRLRELCPEQMAVYEQSIGAVKKEPEKEKSR